jgi:circadian clock protein KaiB
MHELKIIDILENPQLAVDEKILATPTLSRVFRGSIKRVIGDLGNREKVLFELGLP